MFMVEYTLSNELKKSIQVAQSWAREYHQVRFSPAHLLKSLLHTDVGIVQNLANLGVDSMYLHSEQGFC